MLILIKSIFRGHNLFTFAASFNIMLKAKKLNTIVLIFIVFTIKVLAANVTHLSSPNSLHINQLLGEYSSAIQQKGHYSKTTIKADIIDFTNTEVCEENIDDEEDLVKVNSLAISSVLYSCMHQINFASKLNDKFNLVICDLSLEKYLTLSTLRI